MPATPVAPRHPVWLRRTLAAIVALAWSGSAFGDELVFRLNEREYFRKGGVDVMAFQDFYPEGHQGALSIIQHGVRVASNGDLRLEPTPGQWAPVPRQLARAVDAQAGVISATLEFPDPDKDRKGFNPIEYPDLELEYDVRVRADGPAVIVSVDLRRPLPAAWVGRVGFNLELFPATLFGRGWDLDGRTGLFPPQPNGPLTRDASGAPQPVALARGRRLVVAPDAPLQRLSIESEAAELLLYDGRVNHQNGWFIVRSVVPAGATRDAVRWRVTPHAVPGWRYGPVVHVSQVGYHPAQPKRAVLERDPDDTREGEARLLRLSPTGADEVVRRATPQTFGPFLRYDYRTFDFSNVEREGLYVVEYLEARSNPFRIASDVFSRDVWQPTLEQFLPVQMCHMSVREKYKVWHGLCHMDDALMAPTDLNHFDGYVQGPSTLTDFAPLEHVPGLNVGGWHDAGDDDLRVESQAKEMYILALAYEAFDVSLDSTSVDQAARYVGIREPDGASDILQQIQHGALSVVGAYRSLGRLYRGIITPTLSQYVMGGDVVNNTDGRIHDASAGEVLTGLWGARDDRMVFTEINPGRELSVAAWLAAASRALRGFDDALARDSLNVARELWTQSDPEGTARAQRVHAAVELLLSTGDESFRSHLVEQRALVTERIDQLGWLVGRALPLIDDAAFSGAVREAVRGLAAKTAAAGRENPFGVPYEPHIWGAGWNIQEFGVQQYFLHTAFPDLVGREAMLAALDFVLGCHPGSNTASFASGVGSHSVTTAYGYNRMDWHYIPGGVVSGTGLIRPDFPELKDFPYLWQQAEYVLGGGATNFMFLALAADHLLGAPTQAP